MTTLTKMTRAEWASSNPILADDEIGYEKDGYRMKVGDGVTAWADLPFAWLATVIPGANIKGDPGDPGADGAQGPPGAAGANGGAEVAAAPFSAGYTVTNAWTTIPGWQIVVPANTGPVEVGIPEGIFVNIVTGTNPAGTMFSLEARIVDEVGTPVAYNNWEIYSSAATAQTWCQQIMLAKSIANNAANKTYSVQIRNTKVGTAGCTSGLFASGQGYTDPTLRAIRR